MLTKNESDKINKLIIQVFSYLKSYQQKKKSLDEDKLEKDPLTIFHNFLKKQAVSDLQLILTLAFYGSSRNVKYEQCVEYVSRLVVENDDEYAEKVLDKIGVLYSWLTEAKRKIDEELTGKN